MNALELISSSLRLINVLAAGETVHPGTATDALLVLDQMIDSWNADRLAVFTTRSDDFPLTVGKQSYTLGAGGDFNMARPARIDSVSSIILNNPDNPVEVPIPMYSVEDWQSKIPVKNVHSSFPQVCYDDGGFPLRNLSFWPIPSDANSVRIYSWQGLTQPATLNTAIAFPPGYAEAFRYNLAVRLSAEFAQPVPPVVQALAVQTLGLVKSMNAPSLEMNSDLSPTFGGYNYRADMFGIPY